MPDRRLLTSLTLARATLDRGAERRDDSEWLAQRWLDESSRVLILRGGSAQVIESGSEGAIDLVLVAPSEVTDDGVRLLLGIDDDGVAYLGVLAQSVEGADDSAGAASSTPDLAGIDRWVGLRDVGSELGDRDAGLFVAAAALANWHRTHPRCPRCGVPTEATQGGWSRTCPADSSQHFPRSDPAIIVLVTDSADRALLGRRVDWAPGWFSTLAGFVEAGESAEMTVSREMAEEAGITIDPNTLDYLGSQPWPFPASLMLGYRVRIAADSPVAVGDGSEIAEVRWFTRDELAAGCASGDIRIPPPISIARRLIEHWYGAALPGAWSRD